MAKAKPLVARARAGKASGVMGDKVTARGREMSDSFCGQVCDDCGGTFRDTWKHRRQCTALNKDIKYVCSQCKKVGASVSLFLLPFLPLFPILLLPPPPLAPAPSFPSSRASGGLELSKSTSSCSWPARRTPATRASTRS